MANLSKLFLPIFLLFFLSACTTKTMDMLKSRLGQMDFEEAIKRFGPPTQCAEASIS